VETTTPAAPPAPASPPPRAPVPGQLTVGWRLATTATWILVFVAWSGVWKASRELGIATWWLGPIGAPQPVPVMLIPFLAPGVMVALALNNVRRLPWYGLTAAAIGAAIGIADLSYVRRLGYVEILLAAAGAAVSVASLSGRYVRVDDAEDAPVTGADEATGADADTTR
jgi:hypothetical protein